MNVIIICLGGLLLLFLRFEVILNLSQFPDFLSTFQNMWKQLFYHHYGSNQYTPARYVQLNMDTHREGDQEPTLPTRIASKISQSVDWLEPARGCGVKGRSEAFDLVKLFDSRDCTVMRDRALREKPRDFFAHYKVWFSFWEFGRRDGSGWFTF